MDSNKQIRNEREKITTNTAEIQKIIREYYERLYANKLEDPEEMDKFLEIYSPPKVNQEEIDNLNRHINRGEIESVIIIIIKNSLQTKVQVQMDSLGNSTKNTKKKYKNILILLKLFQKTEEEETLPKSFYEATITLIPKPDKDNKKRKLQANITDEHRCKNPQQNTSKQNPTAH